MLRGLVRFLVVLAVIAGIAFGGFLVVRNQIYTRTYVGIDVDASPNDTFVVTVTPGMSFSRVLEMLYEEDLVRDTLFSGLIVRFNEWGAIMVGEYEVNPTMSLYEMFRLFRGVEVAEVREVCETHHCIIVPEGVEIGVIANIFANNLGFDADELLELWADVEFLEELIEEFWFLTDEILNPALYHPLEGYFYPIRHEIPMNNDDDPRMVTRAMLTMTSRMFSYEGFQAIMEAHDMTVHEILTFASIVQGETADPDDMRTVAGVFFNRLNRGQRLASCVTVHYVYPVRSHHVTYAMTQFESPFNTYMHAGLPPGPINSPERRAIRGVLDYEEHDYLYFIGDIFNCVVDEDGRTGRTHFFENFAQHQNFANLYLNPSYAAGYSVCDPNVVLD